MPDHFNVPIQVSHPHHHCKVQIGMDEFIISVKIGKGNGIHVIKTNLLMLTKMNCFTPSNTKPGFAIPIVCPLILKSRSKSKKMLITEENIMSYY